MPGPDKFDKQNKKMRDLLESLKNRINAYKGPMKLVNSKRISSGTYNDLINFLGEFSEKPEQTYAGFTENLHNLINELRNDINLNSGDKLSKDDKEMLNFLRIARDQLSSVDNILYKHLDAQKTIEDYYREYGKSDSFNTVAKYLAKSIGVSGIKPSYQRCQKLSIEGNAPEDVVPHLVWLSNHDAMIRKVGINARDQSIYQQTLDRLEEELAHAPIDVQAKYAVYLNKYEFGLRLTAKEHYDEYLKNAPKEQDPEVYALSKLKQDPVYWSCENMNSFISGFESSRMGDAYCGINKWTAPTQKLSNVHFGPSPIQSEAYSFIGNLIDRGLGENQVSNTEIEEAKKELKSSGYVVNSPNGVIAYAYSELLKDNNGKGGVLFESMKYNFNQFAILDHEDIGILSRKNYYGKLSLAENAINRYLDSFKGKTPKGEDLGRINLVTKMKEALAEHRVDISKSAPCPKEEAPQQLQGTNNLFKTVQDIMTAVDKVDPAYIKSSKEFKAIKKTILKIDAYVKSLEQGRDLKPDQMEILREYCELLDLQSESYIELKEDPIRSPKQEHLKDGSNTEARYNFVKQLQATVRSMHKSIEKKQKDYIETLAKEKKQDIKGDDAPFTALEYFEHIRPLINEQIRDAALLAKFRFHPEDEGYKKASEQLCKRYDITNSVALDYAFAITGLRAFGLHGVKKDIEIDLWITRTPNIETARWNPYNTLEHGVTPTRASMENLLIAEILESRLMDDPNSLNDLDDTKYDQLQENVKAFIEEKFTEPFFTSTWPKRTTADRLLKDFCTKDGIKQRMNEFKDFVKEKKLVDPTASKPEAQNPVLN